MVTGRAGEIVLNDKRYKLTTPLHWQRQPVMRAARKIGGGEEKYSDYTSWSVKAWDTWHLGRGEEYHETRGRYYDAWNIEARIRGQITLGPHIYPTAIGATSIYHEGGTTGYDMLGQTNGPYAWCESFDTPAGGFQADAAQFWLKRVGLPDSNIKASLCADDDGKPNVTALKTKTITNTTIPSDHYAWVTFDWTGTQELTAETTYWLVLSVASLSAAYYSIGESDPAGYAGGDCQYTTESDWSEWTDYSAYVDLWFRLVGAEGELVGLPARFAFFNDNGTEKLFVAAGSQVYYWDAGNDKWVNDGADTGVTDEAFTGTGEDDMTTGGYYNGRTAVSFKVVIDGTGTPNTFKWSDDDGASYEAETVAITGAAQALNNGMTITFGATTGHDSGDLWTFDVGLITDMQVFDDSLIVAQGTLDEMRRKNAGSWGDCTDSEKGTKLGLGICPTGGDAGKIVLIKSGPTSGTDRHKVRCVAVITDTWQDLKSVNNQDTIVGDSTADITWIGQYQGNTWICKEDGVYEIGKDGNAYNKFPFFTQKAYTNFWGACVWHRNELMLPAAYGLWSFDGHSLKNIGPGVGLSFWAGGTVTVGESGEQVGLPDNRQGMILDLLPTVNSLYAAVNAGFAHDRYSSVVLWTGRGWHEVVRADTINKETLCLGFTPAGTIETQARLWYGHGKNIFYVILPDTTDDPYQWASSKYENAGGIDFGWFNAGLFDVDKDFRSVTIEAENVDASQRIEVTYLIDDDTTATSLGTIDDGTVGTAISSNQATLSFGADTYGKRIKLAVYMATNDIDETPKILNVKLKYRKVPDVVWSWRFGLHLIDSDLDRSWRAQEDDLIATIEEKEPVTLVDPAGTSHTVHLDEPVIMYKFSDTGMAKAAEVKLLAWEAG